MTTISVGFMYAMKKTAWNPRVSPRLACGWNHPIKDLDGAGGPQGKWQVFQHQTRAQNQCFYFLSERVCRLLLPSEAAEVFGPSGRTSSRNEPNFKRVWEILVDKQLTSSVGGDVFLCCLFKSFLLPLLSRFGEKSSSNSTGKLRSFTPEVSQKLRVWRCWVDYFVGGWTSFGFSWETVDLSSVSLSSPTRRRHALDFPSFTTHGHRLLPLACSRGLVHLLAHLLVRSSSSTLLFRSLVIGLVSLSRRFHLVVLRM